MWKSKGESRKMRNIKKEYKKYVVSYFVIYLLINFLVIIYKYNFMDINTISLLKENETIIKPIYSLICVPLLSIIGLLILNIVPSNVKEILIFWKINNRLPSYRWQNKIVSKDSRINIKILNKKYGKNISSQKQHDIWYKAYQKYKAEEVILESQKDYLFSRDLCITTVLIMPIILAIYILSIICLHIEIDFIIVNMTILIILYIIFNIVSRNNANRFICNVLLLDSTLQ